MGDDDEKYDPLEIVRYARGPAVFGFAPSTLKAKIDAGLVPAPIPLSQAGIALGWTREMITNHHINMAKLGAEKRAAAALMPAVKREKPAALIRANARKAAKTKKQKLRPAAKHVKT